MPAPIGNVNNVRHGMRSKRHGLVHAKLGRRFANAYGHVNQLRKAVETLLVERHGSLSLLQQAKVQSLLRLEEGIRACEKAIAESPNMKPDEVRQQRYAIAQWTMQRDSLLGELLGNAKATADPWAVLDMPTMPTQGEIDHAARRMAVAVERGPRLPAGSDDVSFDQDQGT